MLNLQEYLRLKCYWIMNSLNDLIETKLKKLQNISNFIYVFYMQYKSIMPVLQRKTDKIKLQRKVKIYAMIIKKYSFFLSEA